MIDYKGILRSVDDVYQEILEDGGRKALFIAAGFGGVFVKSARKITKKEMSSDMLVGFYDDLCTLKDLKRDVVFVVDKLTRFDEEEWLEELRENG